MVSLSAVCGAATRKIIGQTFDEVGLAAKLFLIGPFSSAVGTSDAPILPGQWLNQGLRNERDGWLRLGGICGMKCADCETDGGFLRFKANLGRRCGTKWDTGTSGQGKFGTAKAFRGRLSARPVGVNHLQVVRQIRASECRSFERLILRVSGVLTQACMVCPANASSRAY
jgi:hypothetical protein